MNERFREKVSLRAVWHRDHSDSELLKWLQLWKPRSSSLQAPCIAWESACSEGFEGLICGELLLQMQYMYMYMYRCNLRYARSYTFA